MKHVFGSTSSSGADITYRVAYGQPKIFASSSDAISDYVCLWDKGKNRVSPLVKQYAWLASHFSLPAPCRDLRPLTWSTRRAERPEGKNYLVQKMSERQTKAGNLQNLQNLAC